MALTLADIAKVEREPLRKGVMMNLLRFSDILGVLPFENVNSLSNIVVRWKTLPSVEWRKLNAGYSESTGTYEQIAENLYILGGDVDIDTTFKKIKNLIEDPEVSQTRMKLKAAAYEFNDAFINGSQLTEEDQFNGLAYRVSKMPTRQLIYADASGDGTGASLKVMADSTNQNLFVDAVDEAMAYVEGGADALFMNEKTKRLFSSVLRRLGLFDTSQDQFGREVPVYKGARLVDVGLQADKATENITNTETESSGDDSTSIYAVHFEVGEGLIGIQLEPLDAYVVADELESKPSKRIRIDWHVGLANWGDYSICRLCGFKMAAS